MLPRKFWEGDCSGTCRERGTIAEDPIRIRGGAGVVRGGIGKIQVTDGQARDAKERKALNGGTTCLAHIQVSLETMFSLNYHHRIPTVPMACSASWGIK